MLATGVAGFYQWYVGKKAIVGANSATYQAYFNAAYKVKTGANIRDVCSQFSDEFAVSNSEFEDLNRFEFEETDSTIVLLPLQSLNVMPIPANDVLQMSYQVQSKDGFVSIKLYNSLGALVYEKLNVHASGNRLKHQIQVSELAAGVYKLLILDGKSLVYKTVAIE